MKIRKAIIPAAGLGTRLLPATKAIPKEMLTIVDKPVIQYVVEEAVEAGITEILIIISKGKEAIINHFNTNGERIAALRKKGKSDMAEQLLAIDKMANISVVYQKPLNGLGDAIRYGEAFVENDPFAILLGDSIMYSEGAENILNQMVAIAESYSSSVVAVSEIERSNVYRYGVLKSKDIFKNKVIEVDDWIEKPNVDDAPSNIVISGRYIFTPTIFECLKKTQRGYGNEIQLTDAMRLLLRKEKTLAYLFDGKRFDVGNKMDFIKTNVFFGMKDMEIQKELSYWLSNIR